MIEKDLELYDALGEKLRDIRLSKKLSLANVASRLHIAPKTLQRYECGERKIKHDILIELTKIYEIDYYQLIKDIRLEAIRDDYHINFISNEGNLLLAESSTYPATNEYSYDHIRDLIENARSSFNNEQKIELIKLLSQ